MSHPPPFSEPGRRIAVRKALRVRARLVSGGASAEVHTRDLARDGLSFVSARPIAPGTRCQVVFDVPLGSGESAALAASMRVVYSSYVAPAEFRVGAIFSELDAAAEHVLDRFAASS